jgi:emfourin
MRNGWVLHVMRSGGFAGLAKTVQLDRTELDFDDAVEVERLLDELTGRRRPRPEHGAADRFQYDFTLVRGRDRKHVTVGEGELTREQRALVKRLMGRGQAR